MNTPILNRAFEHPADSWYQIEVPGEHVNAQSGVVQVIDAQAVTSIVNRFNQEADAYETKHGMPYPGMLIDHEHFKHDPKKESIAYGWLMRLDNRNNKPFGQIRWTNTGKPAIDGGDYRFFSSEYDPKDLQVLNRSAKTARVRPLRLDGLTLTNDPNNKGGAPITNRNTLADSSESAVNQQQQNQRKDTMKSVATKLGLSAEANEDSILAEVTKLQNRVTTLEPLSEENTKLKNRVAQIDADAIDALLAERGVKDAKVLNRLRPVLQSCATREERLATLDDFGFKVADTTTTTTTRVLNRGTGAAVEKKAQDTDQAARDRAAKVMNRAQAIMEKTPSLGLATATSMAASEIPE
jgi:phage I-like protein